MAWPADPRGDVVEDVDVGGGVVPGDDITGGGMSGSLEVAEEAAPGLMARSIATSELTELDVAVAGAD